MRAVLRWLFGGKAQRPERRAAIYITSTRTHELADHPLQAFVPSEEKVLEGVSPAANPTEVFLSQRKLRELDADIAVEFWFFSSAEFSSRWDLSPKGLLRDGDYDKAHSGADRRQPVLIPHYSSNSKDFLALEDRVKSWHAGLYLLNLSSQELNESSATLEQKCRAALQARRSAALMGTENVER
jgi:hypothetical protein